MKYILDEKPIIKFLCDKKLALKNFAKQMKMSLETLDNALDGQPVTLQTVRKIAGAIGYQASSLIIGQISTKGPPPSRPQNSALYNRQLTENRYSKWK